MASSKGLRALAAQAPHLPPARFWAHTPQNLGRLSSPFTGVAQVNEPYSCLSLLAWGEGTGEETQPLPRRANLSTQGLFTTATPTEGEDSRPSVLSVPLKTLAGGR